MPIRRARSAAVLVPALTGLCALLLALDGRLASGAGAHPLGGLLAPRTAPDRPRARGAERPTVARSAALRPAPADSATVRRAADLVRRAREAERAAGSTAGAPATAGAAAAASAPPVGITGVAAPTASGIAPLDPTLADSARRTYLAAAALVPEVADWLRLRAAGVTRDAAARAELLRTVRVPAARERAPLVEATAQAHNGDLAGAATTLDALGRPAQASALRLQGASDPAARARVRATLLTLLDTTAAAAGPAPAGVAEPVRDRARLAAVLLDSVFASDGAAPLTPVERTRVARALTTARDPATLRRAAAAFAAARVAPGATPQPADLLAEGAVLARAGQWRDAAAAYARLQGAAAPWGPTAGYERAHALVRAGDAAGARAALRAVADAAPTDSAAAAARFLLAELTADDGQEAAARAEYLRVAREQPTARWAAPARFRAGIIALAAGDPRAAAGDFDAAAGSGAADSVVADSSTSAPSAPTATAATYWAGRAWAAAGDSAQARARWTATLARDPGSYYAWRAATRVGQAWTPVGTGGGGTAPASAITPDPAADAAGARAGLLEQLALTPEAGYERDFLIRGAGDVPARMLQVARALEIGPRPGAGIRLATRAVERGAPRSSAVWQLIDPLRYGDALRRTATAARVDPALAAGVIRQESNFTADALSPVGARGLMQLMPEVGRGLWRGEGGARSWTADLLFVPEVNLALGMRHLAAGLGGYPDPAYALAAYNAGGARVARWRRQPGADDPELFVERIPYAETRDYVRIVLRNRELYRALYRL